MCTRRRLRLLALCSGLLGVACGGDRQTQVLVFAASSLGEALQEIAAGFAAVEPGVEVRLALGGSSVLARQIGLGAPCHVFAAADAGDMQALETSGAWLEPRTLAANTLVVCTRDDGPEVERLADLGQLRRLAVGDPDTAPVGRYAEQALRGARLLPALEPMLLECEHARQITASVASGAADAGIAYRTDVGGDPRLHIRFALPAELHAPIEYQIALARTAPAAARRFVDHALGEAGRAVLARRGFEVGAAPAAGAGSGGGPRPGRDLLSPLWLSLRVAVVATILAGLAGLALAAKLADGKAGPSRDLLAALADLPLVLPPTVVGLALLELVAPRGPVGALVERTTGARIAFTWGAAVLASAIMALPLVVRSARAALESVPRRYVQAARSLGATPWAAFWSVRLPLARRGVLAGLVLGFFRALGEFGATLMVAGNIPGRTQTLPLAIYSAVFEGRPGEAAVWVVLVAALALAGALAAQRLAQRWAP